MPEAGPALELLDMLGVPRVRLYRGLLEDLRNQLEGKLSSSYLRLSIMRANVGMADLLCVYDADRIDKCNNAAQLENLLTSSFPYMSIPELKPIPMRVITKLKEIKDLPSQFLQQLIAKPSLLSDLPLQIKQQVCWHFPPGEKGAHGRPKP